MDYNLNEEVKELESLYKVVEDTERFKAILLKIKSRYGRGLGSEESSEFIRRFLVINEPNLEVELTLSQQGKTLVDVDYIVYNWEKEESVHHEIYSTLNWKDPKEIYMKDPYAGIVSGKLLDLFKIIEQQEVFYSK